MPFLEFLRGRVTMTAAGAYAETQIRTPVSKTEELAMLIHLIDAKVAIAPPEDALTTETWSSLHDRPRTDVAPLDDPGCLWHHLVFIQAGVTEGTLTEYSTYWVDEINRLYLSPPILYAKDTIYVGVDCTHASYLASTILRIGYTLERVSSQDFIAALVG